MGKYRVTLHALANMKATMEIEAMSATAAKEQALNALGDQDWKYQGLDENADIEAEVECLVPGEIECEAEARRLITEHWESVKGKVIYATHVLAFDDKDDRDERAFDPPIPFLVLGGDQALTYLDRGDWMDSEYEVEPLVADPRLAGLRTFDVNGRSVCLMTKNSVRLFPHCEDPSFVVVSLPKAQEPAAQDEVQDMWRELQDNRQAGAGHRVAEYRRQQQLVERAREMAILLSGVFNRAVSLTWPTGRAYEGEPRAVGPTYVPVDLQLFSDLAVRRIGYSMVGAAVSDGLQPFQLPNPQRLAPDNFGLRLCVFPDRQEITIRLPNCYGVMSAGEETREVKLQTIDEFAKWLHQQLKERR